jgi:hypothetical protein
MSHNPYTATNSAISQTVAGQVQLYSPAQAACGALLGGPVGLIYFLYANFNALENSRMQKNTLFYGAILVLALLIILPLLPEKFPSAPFTIAYVLAARHVAERHQVTKQGIIDSPQYEFYSNWRVVGFGILCLLGSSVVILGPILALSLAGVIA